MEYLRHYPLVTPSHPREHDSVPGPFYVCEDICITCALPGELAPQNIQWDETSRSRGCTGCDTHCRVVKQPETDKELEALIEAARCSCVEAIRYCGTDEFTLNRFKELGACSLCDALDQSKVDRILSTS